MKREELLDNLYASMDRRELVTLTLRRVNASGTYQQPGRIRCIANHYTSRNTLIVVFDRVGHTTPLAIGLTMITSFRVGP